MSGDNRAAGIREHLIAGGIPMGLSGALEQGFAVGSSYVDLFWTPIVGPSTTALLRWAQVRLTGELERIDTWEIAEALGRLAPSKAAAVLCRATMFACATYVPARGAVVFRRRLPVLGPDRLEKLSPRLQAVHDKAVAAAGIGAR